MNSRLHIVFKVVSGLVHVYATQRCLSVLNDRIKRDERRKHAIYCYKCNERKKIKVLVKGVFQ